MACILVYRVTGKIRSSITTCGCPRIEHPDEISTSGCGDIHGCIRPQARFPRLFPEIQLESLVHGLERHFPMTTSETVAHRPSSRADNTGDGVKDSASNLLSQHFCMFRRLALQKRTLASHVSPWSVCNDFGYTRGQCTASIANVRDITHLPSASHRMCSCPHPHLTTCRISQHTQLYIPQPTTTPLSPLQMKLDPSNTLQTPTLLQHSNLPP